MDTKTYHMENGNNSAEQKKKFYKALFYDVLDAIVMADKNLCVVEINKEFTKLFGYKLKDIIGKDLDDLITKKDVANEAKKLSEKIKKGEKADIESVRYDSKGRAIDVHIKISPIFIDNEVAGAYGIYVDISKKKSAERELLNQNKKLKSLLTNTTEAIVHVDKNDGIVNINDKFSKLFGYKLKDIRGKKINSIVGNEDISEEMEKISKKVLSGKKVDYDCVRFNSKGEKVEVLIKGIPIFDGDKVNGAYAIYSDISKRKQLEREIHEQSFKFKSLFMNSRDAIAMFDENHNILNINNRFTELFGYKFEDVRGKDLDKVVVKEDLFKEANELTKNLLGGSEVGLETVRYGKDGKGIDVLAKGVPIIVDDVVIGGYGAYTDISEKKSAEHEMLEKNLKLKSLFENSTDAIAMVDARDCIDDVNNNFEKLFGYKLKDIRGKKINSIVGNEDISEDMEKISKTALSGEEINYESFRYNLKGEKIEVLVKGVPIYEDNRVIGAYSIYSDISKRKNAEREILKQNLIFKSLFMNSTVAIARIDETFNIVDVNNSFTELFEYKLEDIKGKNIDDVITNENTVDKAREITIKLQNKIQETVETVRFGKDRKAREVSVRGIPIIDNDKVIGGYGIYTDISLRKSIEREIIYMSYHDELTGLYNRRFFEVEFKRLDTKRNYPLSIVFADVNGLKYINDNYGHAKGDSLLKKFANIIKKEFRSDDIIARIGGDEFVAIIPKTKVEDVEKIIERVNEICSKTFIGSIPISISFGLDSKTKPGEDLMDVIKNAEDEMYNNKLIEKFNGK